MGPHRRRQEQGLRQLGHLLRHPQARAGSDLVRRGQVDLPLLHARHAELGHPRRLGLPADLPGHAILGSVDFRASVQRGDRPGHGPDEAAGVVLRLRARARAAHRRLRRATSTSRWTWRSRISARSTRRATRSTSSATRASTMQRTSSISGTSDVLPLPEGRARLRRDGSRRGQAVLEQLGPEGQLHAEPPVWQLLGSVAVGRERPHAAEHRPQLRLHRS